MNRFTRYSFVFIVISMLSACAASGGQDYGTSRFSNFLVIGVAGNYDSRATFERVLASELRAAGVKASPYYLVAGDNKPLTRDDVLAAIEEHGFDAVVVTRVLDIESDIEFGSTITSTEVRRKDEGFLKLFRYDYEELHNSLDDSLNIQVDFTTELYSSATQDLEWSAKTNGPKSDSVALLIDETARLVAGQLRRAGKLAR